MTMDSETIPAAPDDAVQVSLSEIQRLRDELAKIRHYHFVIKRLHGQVAGLYQRLAGTRPDSEQQTVIQ